LPFQPLHAGRGLQAARPGRGEALGHRHRPAAAAAPGRPARVQLGQLRGLRRLARRRRRAAEPELDPAERGGAADEDAEGLDRVRLVAMRAGSRRAALAVLLLLLAACGREQAPQVEPPRPGPIEEVVVVAPAPDTAPAERLPPLFRDIEQRTFQFFWDTTDERNGMTPDRFPSRPFASVAAIGFALTAYPIGIENGWISRRQAVDRTLLTLEFLYEAPQGPEASGTIGHRGFFYHFLDMRSGHRYEHWVELSSVDTGLMMLGVLFAREYYDGDDPREQRIRELADALYARIEWPWLQVRPPLISMGWYPERGFIEHDWTGYDEAMLVYILALGSPTHPVEPEAWEAWTRTYDHSWGIF